MLIIRLQGYIQFQNNASLYRRECKPLLVLNHSSSSPNMLTGLWKLPHLILIILYNFRYKNRCGVFYSVSFGATHCSTKYEHKFKSMNRNSHVQKEYFNVNNTLPRKQMVTLLLRLKSKCCFRNCVHKLCMYEADISRSELRLPTYRITTEQQTAFNLLHKKRSHFGGSRVSLCLYVKCSAIYDNSFCCKQHAYQ